MASAATPATAQLRRRRVLLIARFLPPLGGAGVHRSLGTVRHLPGHGYDVRVITGSGGGLDRWSPEDPGLLAGMPEGTEVHRLAGPEPTDPPWTRRAERLLGRQTPWIRWWLDGIVRTGLEVGADADVIYCSCAPYETAWAGAKLARLLGKPWIADLEDPWAVDEMRVHPSGLHRRLDVHRMRRALSTAAAVVTCAPETAVRLRAALPRPVAEHVANVEIGFDADAFAAVPAGHPAGAPFRIVHTGSMHTALGRQHRASRGWRRALGGMPADVDILTRSHVFLLEAIERVLAAQPALRGRVELHLAGNLTDADRAASAGHDFVVDHGSLAHEATVALMRSADLLFLPMQDLPPGERAGLIPYKTFEYLAAERPILAAVPDGDVRDLLAPLAHATLVRPADVTALAAAVAAS
ncbi:MAG: glycosyltransferase family 4 protein, partial [Conexibacter sp.]|nr:glycosyltransferase family 4 protein [Conexibacter sp.]